jgi:hypothetical protein
MICGTNEVIFLLGYRIIRGNMYSVWLYSRVGVGGRHDVQMRGAVAERRFPTVIADFLILRLMEFGQKGMPTSWI